VSSQVRDHIDTSAFSKLGKDHFDRKEHQEESFPGLDVQVSMVSER
jgi:hypothetical protein